MWTEEILNKTLTTPSNRLIEDMKKVEGDILILGAGGKMGPTLSVLAKKAVDIAESKQRVIAVSRFSDPIALDLLKKQGVDIIKADLMEPGILNTLPDVENVIYMAGRKFGTDGQECFTWAMNTWLPSLVAERYKESKIVVFSSGNVYPMVPIQSGGATEDGTPPAPIGEYGMSCLGRERMFEYGSRQYGTNIFLYRLNYAVDLRYGVLYDIAESIVNERPISLATPCFNCIWQGDANEIALRALLHTGQSVKMNITGPETVSVRFAAEYLGNLLGKTPIFEGEESDHGYLSNAHKAVEVFGYPSVPLNTIIKWQAEWILSGGRSLGKPTHFEERKGKY